MLSLSVHSPLTMAFKINGWWLAKEIPHCFDDDIKVDHYPTIVQGNDALENRFLRVAWVDEYPDKTFVHFSCALVGVNYRLRGTTGLGIMISSFRNYDKSAVILMPIVSKTRTAFIKEGQPHEEASPPKHCRARCLRSEGAPLRSLLSSDGAKIWRFFWLTMGIGWLFL